VFDRFSENAFKTLPKMFLFKSNTIYNFSKFLLILLFVYTGTSKLLGHDLFLSQISQIKFLKNIAQPISFLLPSVEIITSIFLAIDQMQRSGLWLAAFLLTIFTIYVAGMLLLKSSLPCTCGAVISSMSWKQHLWFNLFFMLLSWNALLHYYNPANKIISTNKKEVS